jgi:hypothetical protein
VFLVVLTRYYSKVIIYKVTIGVLEVYKLEPKKVALYSSRPLVGAGALD